MKSIAMTFAKLEVFAATFTGDRSQISYDDGKLTVPDHLEAEIRAMDLSPAAILPSIKAALIAEVNAAAETERLKYITAGAGQALTYQEKLSQARACLAEASPVAADYPMLENEIGISGASLQDVAQAIVDAYAAWQQIGAAIEKVRMAANKAISEAADEASARATRAAITWPCHSPTA